MRIRLKVCCMASIAEARIAIAHGADAVGLVGPMPSGLGIIANETAAEIAEFVAPPVMSVLLTSEETVERIAAHVHLVRPGAVQIVRHIDPAIYSALRKALPLTKIIQVVHVEDAGAVDIARTYGALADALLLDSGRPAAKVAELGGTGRTHDWEVSRRIVETCGKPVFLAGGITPENVGEAIRAVRPFGIDICSGIRTKEGALVEGRLGELVRVMLESNVA